MSLEWGEGWAASTWRAVRGEIAQAEKRGADRERRRIRRAQRGALSQLCRIFDRTNNSMLHDLLLACHVQLNAATRSRGKGKR